MVPVGRLVVLRTTPKSGILRATALLTWPGLTAPLIGPPLGGFLTEAVSWRAIFFVNVPLGADRRCFSPGPGRRRWSAGPGEAVRRAAVSRWPAVALGAALIALDADGRRVALALALLAVVAGFGFRAPFARVAASYRRFRAAAPRRPFASASPAERRRGCSSVPCRFVLPLMFQLGLGFDAMRAGLTVTPLFVGNIGIKPFTTPILRSLGLPPRADRQRRAAGGDAVRLRGDRAATPARACGGAALVSGASRSMHFTALGTLPFADVAAGGDEHGEPDLQRLVSGLDSPSASASRRR